MINFEIGERILDILDLVAQMEGTPVNIYQPDALDQVVEVAGSDKKFLPTFCHAMWEVGGGRGRGACDANMCGRARQTFISRAPQTVTCHSGLLTNTHPIEVDDEIVAVMQYGVYIPSDEDLSARLVQLGNTLTQLGAKEEERTRLQTLMHDPALRKSENEVREMREKLPPHVTRLLAKLLKKFENDRQVFHDLKMRLVAVRGEASQLRKFAARLGEAAKSSAESAEAQNISRRADRVCGAVDLMETTMTSLTRGEYLPRRYTFGPKNIVHFISKGLTLIQAEAERRGIDTVCKINPLTDRKIRGSEEHLQEAFNNLLHNALKYSYHTPHTSVAKKRFILIEGKVVDESYRVWIQNYGIGIERDEVERIFDEGYQGRLTRSERRGGAGQGLALTRRIIDAHAGSITAHSEPIIGLTENGITPYKTTFTITLPLWT